MGKNYVTIPLSHSWERITSFAPWVTHWIELRAFIVRKMPMWSYIGKELHLLPQKDIPVNYQITISFSCGSPEGYPVITSHLT